MKISNWGLYPEIEADVQAIRDAESLSGLLAQPQEKIARGLGRCYGDSALAPVVLSSEHLNRFIEFDKLTGTITCQSGVSLEDVLRLVVPHGWFLPVTPGTKFVTIGGAIAADVHGKNHHVEGSFGQHVQWFTLMGADGQVVTCSREEHAELFETTVGGMGLTGMILSAQFRLKPIQSAYIREETVRAANLFEIMDLFDQSTDWTYSVAWIDCLARGDAMGRSIMMRGEHAKQKELETPRHRRDPLGFSPTVKASVPFHFPSLALNPLTVQAFNFAYFHHCPRGTNRHIVNYDTFFYPLDRVDKWNRIYGRRGFTQYQFVLPKEASREGLPTLLKAITESGLGSFLAVLKLFGHQDSFISFPREGYTLALDFPISNKLFGVLDRLDSMVQDFGGRLYLAKDVRMKPAIFDSGYAHADEFKQRIATGDPDGKFCSLQAHRIGLRS